MKRFFAAFFVALMAFQTMAAWALNGYDDPQRASYYDALKGKRVVFIPLGMGLDLTQAWAAEMKRQADALGYKFEVRDPNWSTEAGAQALTQAITEKPDILIVQNPDVQVYSHLLKRAQTEGIYVVQINLKSVAQTEAFVGPDWVEIGKVLANLAVDKCSPAHGGNGKIAVTQLTLTAASNVYQNKGIQDVLAQHPEMKVVSDQSADTDASKARAITATVLQQNPDVCAVIGGWDGQDIGSAAAVKQAGKTGKVAVFTSGGGERSMCDKVKDGTFSSYISYNAAGQGRDLNDMIRYLLQVKPAPEKTKAQLFSDLTVITQANVNSSPACYALKDIR